MAAAAPPLLLKFKYFDPMQIFANSKIEIIVGYRLSGLHFPIVKLNNFNFMDSFEILK